VLTKNFPTSVTICGWIGQGPPLQRFELIRVMRDLHDARDLVEARDEADAAAGSEDLASPRPNSSTPGSFLCQGAKA
jgi:hypothetical protein